MADICENCGAELFQGQRFCRACGSSTDPISREEAPTQRMPPPPDMRSARGPANTAPTSRPGTNPVYAPPQAFYQPHLPAPPAHPYSPPRSRAPWIPIVVLILAMVLGGAFFGVRSIVRGIRDNFRENTGAETRGSEAVDTRLFDLSKGAAVSLITSNGSIKVEEWDQPRAEVRIIKRGNSADDIQIKSDKDNLSLDASHTGNSQVRFEVKLPHDLGAVKFVTANGPVEVSDIAGSISVVVANGSVKLNDVSGVESVVVGNGTIKADLNEVPPNRPMKFEAANGSIDLTFNDANFDVNLEASTIRGSIDIDDEFNITVQKSQPVGARASGQIGKGGPLLKVSTANGSIRINK